MAKAKKVKITKTKSLKTISPSSQETTPPALEEPTKPTTTAKPKKSFTYIIVAGLILIAGILGWGFYNGSKTKAYANKAESIYQNFQKNWSMEKVNIAQYDSGEEYLEKVKEIKAETEKALAEISKLSGTSKTKELQNNLQDYFTTIKTVAETAEYMDNFLSIEKLFTALGAVLTSPNDPILIENIATAQKELDKTINKLKETKTPLAFKEFNDQLIGYLERISEPLDELNKAAKASDPEAAAKATTAYLNSLQSFNLENELKNLDEDQIMQKVFPTSDKDKVNNLEKKIESAISSLKNTIFVLF